MATSGKITGTTKNSSGTTLSYYGTWVNWKVNSTNIANNTKNITIDVIVQRTDGMTGTTAYNLNDKPTVSLKVGGSSKTPTVNYLDTRNLKVCTIATWTGNVTHNADGTLTLPIVVSWTVPNLTYLASGSISGNATLDTIPRASTIGTVTGNTIGGSCTVNITRASSNFTHQLWYKVGNSSWYNLGTGIGTSKAFTIDIATANQLPNATSGTMQLCVRTFNGSTQIGSDVYKDVTVNVPNYSPTISNIALTGNNLLSGAYVQGKSTVKVAITASTMYGATIKSYSSTVDGKTYTGNSFTSSTLSNGSKTVSVTITDSRGKTATLSSSAFTVYAYANPSITEFTLARQSDGTTVIATVKGTISAINNKNAKTITVTLNGVTQTITSSSYTINDTTTFTNVPTDSTFTATAKLTDSYTNVTKDATLPTVAVTEDYHYSGKGKALGKVSETEGLFEVDWDAQFNKAVNIKRPALESLSITRTDSGNGAAIKFANKNGVLGYVGMSNNANGGLIRWTHDASSSYIVLDTDNTKDYVVEQGTSNYWTYRKWNSGVAECWKTVDTSTGAFSGTSPTFYVSPGTTYAYPTDLFTSVKSVQLTVAENSGAVITAFNCSGTDKTYCEPAYIRLYGGSTSVTIKVSFYIVGTWK